MADEIDGFYDGFDGLGVLCNAAVQTEDVHLGCTRCHAVQCDATTQTTALRHVPSFDILLNGKNASSNGGSASITDTSTASSVVTVINRAEFRQGADQRRGSADGDVGDGDDQGTASTPNEVGENHVTDRSIRESQSAEGRQIDGTIVQDLNEDQSLDGAVTMPLLCPAGLECLLDTSQMVIHMGNLRHDLFMNVKNIRRMEAINEMRRVLFYVEQDPPSTPSFENSFLFRFYNRNKQEVMQVYNPASQTCFACGLNWHWFNVCHFQAVVYSPPGTLAGFIRRQQTCFVQEFQILGPCEEVLLRLRGAPSDLKVYSVDLLHELGRLSIHGWVGVMHEIRRTANDYGLTFPLDLDVHVKALLLSSVVVIDWLYSTRGGRR